MCDGVDEMKRYEHEWHLDKRVPIALIVTVLGQFMLVIVLASVMWTQVKINTKDISTIQNIMPEVYRMVENTEHMKEDLRDIKDNMQSLTLKLYEHDKARLKRERNGN